jgi:hypothetical protein
MDLTPIKKKIILLMKLPWSTNKIGQYNYQNIDKQ